MGLGQTTARIAARLAVVLVALLAAAPAHASRIFAVTPTAEPQSLISFDSAAPGTLLSEAPISGLAAGDVVVGMDVRPETGRLNLLTVNGTTDRLYLLDAVTGVASSPVTLIADPVDATAPFTSINVAGGVGVDYNPFPTPNRFRIVEASGRNLRVNPVDGLVTTDADTNPGTPAVSAVAYTNSFPGAPSVTLYGYDFSTNTINFINPPNNGTVTPVGGGSSLTPTTSASIGLDLTPDNVGYLTAQTSGSRLYGVDLTTGLATDLGTIGNGTRPIAGIAVAENAFAFSTPTVSATEAGGGVTLTVTRLGPRNSASVDFATADGSAVAGSDYTATSGGFGFSGAEAAKTIFVPIAADGAEEADETFTVTLSNGVGSPNTNFMLSSPQTVTVTIDEPPLPPDTEAPETTVGKRPKKRIETSRKRVRVTITFSSDDAGASFECKLDKAAVEACTSPFKKRVRLGAHKLLIAAVDSAGNVDATPAKVRWSVVSD